jgi:hypothetical protein
MMFSLTIYFSLDPSGTVMRDIVAECFLLISMVTITAALINRIVQIPAINMKKNRDQKVKDQEHIDGVVKGWEISRKAQDAKMRAMERIAALDAGQ